MLTNELFERITRRIADAIEVGAGRFEMPWHRWGENTGTPVNAISGRPYRGINVLLLWAAAEASGYALGNWATYKQWAAAGAQVRKGEKATPILFWKSSSDWRDQNKEDEASSRGPRFLAKVYSVFNADQLDGVIPCQKSTIQPEERVASAERFFAATQADVHHGGDRAYYAPGVDQIWLPKFEQFRNVPAYYSTLAHEMVHWTGARHRLDRDLGGRFGNDAYAAEELVAELGSAFIAAHLGLSVEPRPDHAAYISSWLRVLRGDPRAILTASAKAQQAVDFIIALGEPESAAGRSNGSEDELEQIAA